MKTFDFRCYKVVVYDEIGTEISIYKVRILYFGVFLLKQLRQNHFVLVQGFDKVVSSDKEFKYAEFLPF